MTGDLRVAALVGARYGALEPHGLHAGLEAEVFAEVKGVRAARHPARRVEVGRVDPAHGGKLVPERLGEEALLNAPVVPATDQLLLQLLVDALRARGGEARQTRERREPQGHRDGARGKLDSKTRRHCHCPGNSAHPRVSITLDRE